MRLSDVHMHHWRHDHFAHIAIPQGFSPHDEYLMTTHLAELGESPGVQVDLAICVQLSLSDTPTHVIDAVDHAADPSAQTGRPAQATRPRVLGIVAARPERVRDGSLDHPRVAGVRLMLGTSSPEVLDREYDLAGSEWQPLIRMLATRGKHFTTMCTNKETAARLLELVPAEVPVGFDHLALGHAQTNPDDAGFQDLLRAARDRGNVYFKGPGYRTAFDVQAVAAMVSAIVKVCGPEAVLLGATDAPHVWYEPGTSTPLRDRFPHERDVVEYLGSLAALVVTRVAGDHPNLTPDALLSEHALAAYGRFVE